MEEDPIVTSLLLTAERILQKRQGDNRRVELRFAVGSGEWTATETVGGEVTTGCCFGTGRSGLTAALELLTIVAGGGGLMDHDLDFIDTHDSTGRPWPMLPDPGIPERRAEGQSGRVHAGSPADPNPFPRIRLFRWSRRRA